MRQITIVVLTQLFGPCSSLSATSSLANCRTIKKLEKPIRLPVWPVASGLISIVLDFAGLEDAARWWEDKVGGRVCPMMLDTIEADPFVLLVHHRHSFKPWDPLRPLSNLVLPEGFPSHPHRGLETATITLRGGLAHRDSLGRAEVYGDGQVQWLCSGKGILHEEMWSGEECELYQLWINLPQSHKYTDPFTQVFLPHRPDDSFETHLGGSLGSEHDKSKMICQGADRSDVRISRIQLAKAGEHWHTSVPAEATVLLYCRSGCITLDDQLIPAHRLAYTERGTTSLEVIATKPDTDVLVLCGLPLREPIFASGTWVLSSQAELNRADIDYASGKFGRPWEHTFSDEQWRNWISKFGPTL
mmetsp:Transcript_17708/g.26591  ORF Transcript_17708/g.26591 Transcript_17708/m.26591 type:complete len:359 (-) Transcript_17708:98-1174(-)